MIVMEDNNLKGFECTGTLIWLYRIISLIELKCRAFSVVPASLRLNYVEGSLSNQWALAQLVESMKRSSKSPNALPSIPNRASVNPQLRFRQSPIAFPSIPNRASSKALLCSQIPIGKVHRYKATFEFSTRILWVFVDAVMNVWRFFLLFFFHLWMKKTTFALIQSKKQVKSRPYAFISYATSGFSLRRDSNERPSNHLCWNA